MFSLPKSLCVWGRWVGISAGLATMACLVKLLITPMLWHILFRALIALISRTCLPTQQHTVVTSSASFQLHLGLSRGRVSSARMRSRPTKVARDVRPRTRRRLVSPFSPVGRHASPPPPSRCFSPYFPGVFRLPVLPRIPTHLASPRCMPADASYISVRHGARPRLTSTVRRGA